MARWIRALSTLLLTPRTDPVLGMSDDEQVTDPTSRALSLLRLLQVRRSWQVDELAAELGVTPRTVRRDIARLRELGYTVNSGGGLYGGYHLGQGGLLPPLALDLDQAVAVALALTDAAAAGRAHADAALQALHLLQEIVPPRVRRRPRGLIEASEAGIPHRTVDAAAVDPKSLLHCMDAIQQRLMLGFDYTDRHGRRTDRRVEPHRLVPVRGRWMLVAYDPAREDWRTFRFDRLSEPEILLRHCTPRPGLNEVLARLDEPTPPTAWRHQVVVLIHAPLGEVAETMPRLAGHLQPVGESETEFRTGAEDPDDAARWLSTLRQDFTVLGDEEVHQAMRRLSDRLGRSVADSTG